MRADFFNFEDDIHYYVLWARQRNRGFQNPKYLPVNGVCVKDDDGCHVAMAFLYITDAGFGTIAGVMTSPLNDKILNREAVLMAIRFLLDVGTKLRLGYISTVANHPRLLGFYKELGFNEGEENLTVMCKELKSREPK